PRATSASIVRTRTSCAGRWTPCSPTSCSTSPAICLTRCPRSRNFKGERYIFISTGVYPHLHGKPAREEDFVPLEGDPPGSLDYFDGKRWCETLLARTRDFPWTVIRPPAIFGAADRTLRIAAYIQRVADGGPVLVPVESYERQAGLAWVEDVGVACALASDPRTDATRT